MKKDGIVRIDGYELVYRMEGEGLPVMLIGSSLYFPRLFSPELRKACKWVFIDHRGFVPPPREGEPLDGVLDRILEDTEIIRKELGLEDVVIAGHSGNAFLALEYAIRHPGSVRKVALMNTAPTNSAERQEQSMAHFQEVAEPDRKKKLEQDLALLPGDLEREPERRFAHMCIRMGALGFYDWTFDAAPLWDGVVTHMPVIDHLWGDVFGRMNLIESLTRCDKPVWLALGRHDHLVGPCSLWDSVEEKHRHVTKVIFEQSGHNPMLEEPGLFDERFLAWLRE
ncbi:alpha/beta fold hydrolase [Staphylospora marina]|uniref:alpha/beta fold hydrolase n=1 Tax=Staphylospora marina TaxID=2490858 RepID=UPI000F5BDCB3|nr:alpha/beta hydrolase [Staphylospora marina]